MDDTISAGMEVAPIGGPTLRADTPQAGTGNLPPSVVSGAASIFGASSVDFGGIHQMQLDPGEAAKVASQPLDTPVARLSAMESRVAKLVDAAAAHHNQIETILQTLGTLVGIPDADKQYADDAQQLTGMADDFAKFVDDGKIVIGTVGADVAKDIAAIRAHLKGANWGG